MPFAGAVVGYARVSTEEQSEADRAGLPRQREAIEAYALRYGHEARVPPSTSSEEWRDERGGATCPV